MVGLIWAVLELDVALDDFLETMKIGDQMPCLVREC